MGSSASKEAENTPRASSPPPPPTPSSGCPVQHEPPAKQQSGCPVMHEGNDKNLPFNVYSQPIDPSNQMPSSANQRPSPLQKAPLSTERVTSTIPKGNTQDGETWTYPSPQMFYNALVRKGKWDHENNNGEDATTEEDMESVVALHNNMNERTWQHVVEWENLMGEDHPKLLKFRGRPTELSYKAWIKHVVWNHPLPFDRHDWTVQRSDGTTVTYIIDYYHNDQAASAKDGSGVVPLHEKHVPSLLVDVRPGDFITQPSLWITRCIRMPFAVATKATTFTYLPLRPNSSLKTQVRESKDVWRSIQQDAKQSCNKESTATEDPQDSMPTISDREATALATSLSKILKDCQSIQERVQQCQTDQECQKASLDLQLCMAQIWCPVAHSQLVQTLQQEGGDEDAIPQLLENLTDCVAAADQRTQQAKVQHSHLF